MSDIFVCRPRAIPSKKAWIDNASINKYVVILLLLKGAPIDCLLIKEDLLGLRVSEVLGTG